MQGMIGYLPGLMDSMTGLLADGATPTAIETWMARQGGVEANAQVLILTVLVILAVAVPAALMAISWTIHRHNGGSNPTKEEAFECGLSHTVGTADERFSVKFYLIAMLFLVFDLEVAFLYPWAVHFGDGGWGMVGLLLVFLVILEAGYLYLFRKGALDWDD